MWYALVPMTTISWLPASGLGSPGPPNRLGLLRGLQVLGGGSQLAPQLGKLKSVGLLACGSASTEPLRHYFETCAPGISMQGFTVSSFPLSSAHRAWDLNPGLHVLANLKSAFGCTDRMQLDLTLIPKILSCHVASQDALLFGSRIRSHCVIKLMFSRGYGGAQCNTIKGIKQYSKPYICSSCLHNVILC